MPKQHRAEHRGGVSDCNGLDELNRSKVNGSYQSLGLLKYQDTDYFNIDASFTKNIVLNKYFKSTENQQKLLIYENLCISCGYGVFEAKGRLCNFCQFVTNGYLDDDNISNIYENICDKCGSVYSGNDCNLCSIKSATNSKTQAESMSIFNKNNNNNNNNSNNNNYQIGDSKNAESKKTKKNIFRGLIGSLKRAKRSTTTTSDPMIQSRKLEIVHNVGGVGNVFRTNETFDLNRICELKRLNSSSSEQHIYGKLRISGESLHENNSKSDPALHKIQLHQQTKQTLENLPISSHYKNSKVISFGKQKQHKSKIYLQDNVIDWMTSLRHEIHDYRSFGAPDTVICNPKSIPAKYQFSCSGFVDQVGSIGCGTIDFGSFENIINTSSSLYSKSERNVTFDKTIKELFETNFIDDQLTYDRNNYNRMIDDFKLNIMEKQVKLRSKRKAIYLNVDADSKHLSSNGIENEKSYELTNTTINTDTATSTAVICDENMCSSSSCQSPTSTIDSSQSVRNRCGGLYQSSNRNGFYEKDSDFVSDILNAFDLIIKRDFLDNCVIGSIKNNNNNNNNNSINSENNNNNNNNNIKNSDLNNCSSDNEVNLSINDLNTNNDRINKKLQNIGEFYNAATALVTPSCYSNQIELFNSHKEQQQQLGINCGTIIIYGNSALTNEFVKQINLKSLIVYLALSSSLNKIVLTYDRKLFLFLQGFRSEKFSSWDNARLVRLFKKLCSIERKKSLKDINRISKGIQNTNPNQNLTTDHLQLEFPKITMTVPTIVQQSSGTVKDEENIYQPIWKFKTVGQANDKYTDSYCDGVGDSANCDGVYCESESARTHYVEEDHGEWEIDDEFYFSTKVNDKNSDVETMSVITNASSTITGSVVAENTCSTNNVCILYSITEPKIRAIIYDYNRNNFDLLKSQRSNSKQCGRYTDLKKETFENNSPPLPAPRRRLKKAGSESVASKINSIPDSVQAWKFMLLNVNYLEDEEDMYVSENDFLSSKIPEKIDTPLPPPPTTLNKFKSHSIDNLVDALEDKKSITESLKNIIFSKGVLKLNSRQPRDRRFRDIFKRQQDTMSLYIDDDIKIKYPVFGVKLTDVEPHPTECFVPRFVVDCIKCIEDDESIKIDGLYRASGNKTVIDELKKKLNDSYIYDEKLLQNNDVHILTGLLKMFFRELKTSLINYDLLRRLPENLVESSSLVLIKEKFLEIEEPSKTTLKHLFRHLTRVASFSSDNRMPASNLAIVWGPCLLSADDFSPMDIPRINTLTKVVIEGYNKIFEDNTTETK